MFGLKSKILLALGVTGLLGAAPASAYSPYPRPTPVHVDVSLPSFYLGVGFGAPVYRPAPRVDHYQLQRGIELEQRGHALITRGERLERRGWVMRAWYLQRKGERLQARGRAMVAEGRELQARARW